MDTKNCIVVKTSNKPAKPKVYTITFNNVIGKAFKPEKTVQKKLDEYLFNFTIVGY